MESVIDAGAGRLIVGERDGRVYVEPVGHGTLSADEARHAADVLNDYANRAERSHRTLLLQRMATDAID